MKRILEFIVIAAVAYCSTGCESYEEWWENGRPDLEHTYILFLDQPENQVDWLSYEIAQNGDARWRFGPSATSGTWIVSDEQWVASVPFILDKRIGTLDVVSYVWMESTLTASTDYLVTNEDDAVITPDANGGYPLYWPYQAEIARARQSIKIKRIQGSPNGTIKVQTFNRANGIPVISDVTSLVNNKTAEYEVRCASLDVNKVTITFN